MSTSGNGAVAIAAPRGDESGMAAAVGGTEYYSVPVDIDETLAIMAELSQNLELRLFMSGVQELAIIGGISAFMVGAFETAKMILAVYFAVGFAAILLLNLEIDLKPVAVPIMMFIGFFIFGMVAAANGSSVGLYMALLCVVLLVVTVAMFYWVVSNRGENEGYI